MCLEIKESIVATKFVFESNVWLFENVQNLKFDTLASQKYLSGFQMELPSGKMVLIVLGAKICKSLCKSHLI